MGFGSIGRECSPLDGHLSGGYNSRILDSFVGKGPQLKSIQRVCVLLPAVCAAIAIPAAAADAEFTAGMKDYNAKNFKGAAEHFDKSIKGGNKAADVWLYSGNCFSGMGQYQRALQTYEVVIKSFKGTQEAAAAEKSIDAVHKRLGPTSAGATTGGAPAAAGDTGLMARIVVTPPQFGHKPVLPSTIAAAREAVAALPAPLRKMLDDSDARVILSPNLIDRWPESIKDLPETGPELNLAELPGRIYGKDMCIYERAKVRGSNALKEARPPKFTRLQVGNMCFQVLDDMMTISKDPALRKEWEADKKGIPESMAPKLWTFMKEDDWGPRETCSELFGAMIGGYDENTDNLYRYFPHTKRWLAARLGVK